MKYFAHGLALTWSRGERQLRNRLFTLLVLSKKSNILGIKIPASSPLISEYWHLVNIKYIPIQQNHGQNLNSQYSFP